MFCVICKHRIKPHFNGIPKEIFIPVCSAKCLSIYMKNNFQKLNGKSKSHDIKFEIIHQTNNFKSSVEEEVAEKFLEHNINFCYENVLIYDDEYNYIPDFYLPDFKCFLEIKSGHKQRLIKVKHFTNKGIPIYVAWL